MEASELKKLIDKYFEGETSLDEERKIKETFENNPELQHRFPESALFLALVAEKEVRPSKDLAGQFEQPEAKVRHMHFGTTLKWAASIVIVLSTIFLLFPFNPSGDKAYSDSFENPEEAYEEARKALAMVGGKMNHGRSGAANKIQKFNTVIPLKN